MNSRTLFFVGMSAIGLCGAVSVGCKPRTPAQKVEDKVEDAQHEVHQGMERAKENVEDGIKK